MFGNKDTITKKQLEEALAPLQKQIADLQHAVKALSADYYNLTQRIGELEASKTNIEAPEVPVKTALDKQEITSPQAPQPLYLPAPTPDGRFTESSTTEQVGKSIFLLQTNDQRQGTFALIDSPDALATAMISVSQFLKPVCRIEGNTRQQPQRIETVEEGTAQLKDGEWTVSRKALIKFI